VLLEAWSRDPASWKDYHAHSLKTLELRSPTNADNVRAYRERLLAVVEGRHE